METPITKLPVYNEIVPYVKADGQFSSLDVPFFELPRGTILFRGVQLPNPKKDEDPRLFVRDWLGYPKGDRFCMTPTHNTFFYTSPYVPFGAHTVGEYFNAIMVYQTVKDLRLVCMISPSKMTRGGKEIKALDGTAPIQRCDKFDYTCFEKKTSIEAKKEKETKSFDNCIHPNFAASNAVSGWMAIADYDSLDNFKEGLRGKETTMGKYIMELDARLKGKGIELLTSTYTDGTGHRGFPEIVLFPWSPHPGKENQYTEAPTQEDAADAIAEMSDRFNYLPIACITERGILEAFSGDFKAADLPAFATTVTPGSVTRRKIDELQSEYLNKMMTKGATLDKLGNIQMVFDKRTGFYMMAGFQGYYVDEKAKMVSPYNDFMLTLTNEEERRRVIEYKIKYRSFDIEKLRTEDTLLDGTVVTRDFVFERPDQLYKQFKELEITLPSQLIPYIWEATQVFQQNIANRKSKTNVRLAEEARRKADEAKAKIQESLDIIAKKKAELGKKNTGKPTKPSGPLPLPAFPAPAVEFPKEPEPIYPDLLTAPSYGLPITPQYGPSTPTFGPSLPPSLQGEQTQIPIIRDYNEAFSIGKAIIDIGNLKDKPRNNRGLMISYERPWEMNEKSLALTLKYIFDKLHHTCYMLCIHNNNPYIFKLEPGGMNPKIRDILEQEIKEKGITDINLDRTRIMQCILKPYSQEGTTATEWLGFLRSMKKQQLPNGVFILNLTDAMILREDVNEPFGYFTKGLVPLETEYRKGYFLPIFAYSGHRKYDDIPIPNFDDIFEIRRTMVGEVDLMATFGDNATYDWISKDIPKAVFRGGTTGCGATAETNQRIRLCSEQFLSSLKNREMLDVGITTITRQYKMDKDGLKRVDPSTIQAKEPISMEMQTHYKYIIHVDGNVHAYRLLKTMLTGSCILRVSSPYYGWADSKLIGFDIDDENQDPSECHFIIVKEGPGGDLSHLDSVLEWCKQNDEMCATIGANAREAAMNFLSAEVIEATFANLLNSALRTALSSGGGRPKQPKKSTRKQVKKMKRKTRKFRKDEPKLVLAKYEGGGFDEETADYIQSTMSKLWKTYLDSWK